MSQTIIIVIETPQVKNFFPVRKFSINFVSSQYILDVNNKSKNRQQWIEYVEHIACTLCCDIKVESH